MASTEKDYSTNMYKVGQKKSRTNDDDTTDYHINKRRCIEGIEQENPDKKICIVCQTVYQGTTAWEKDWGKGPLCGRNCWKVLMVE